MQITRPRSHKEQLYHPYACFTAIREQASIRYDEHGKFWEVTDYNTVQQVVFDHDRFSSDESKFHTAEDVFESRSILNLDPPRHRQLRALVSQAFTPRTIAQMSSRIADITNSLLDDVIGKGQMDVITDLSYPLPVIVIAEMLGVPSSDRARFKRWSDEIVSSEYEDLEHTDFKTVARRARERLRATIEEIDDYFRAVLVERRKRPEQDLISALLAARVDGESLSEQELLGFCTLLLIAGNITTTNLIGNAIICLDEDPASLRKVYEDSSLLPSTIEEVLRFRPPVTLIGRSAQHDLQLGEQHIKRGEPIFAWVACANFDPEQFPQPERFDIQRKPNRHLTFGHGIHFCLGAPLARLEAQIALTIMLQRLKNIQRIPGDLEPVNSRFIFGARHIPVRFSI